MSHRPALVDVVDSQRAQAEDEEHGYEHVVDGPDVADLKQFTGEEEETQRQKKYSHHSSMLYSCAYLLCCIHVKGFIHLKYKLNKNLWPRYMEEYLKSSFAETGKSHY